MSAGRLLPPFIRGPEKRLVACIETAGPTSYPLGGFSVLFEDVTDLSDFTVKVITNPTQLLEADDTCYSVSWSVSDNTVNIVVKSINVTAASPVSWSEIAAGTDLSGVTFIVEVWEK